MPSADDCRARHRQSDDVGRRHRWLRALSRHRRDQREGTTDNHAGNRGLVRGRRRADGRQRWKHRRLRDTDGGHSPHRRPDRARLLEGNKLLRERRRERPELHNRLVWRRRWNRARGRRGRHRYPATQPVALGARTERGSRPVSRHPRRPRTVQRGHDAEQHRCRDSPARSFARNTRQCVELLGRKRNPVHRRVRIRRLHASDVVCDDDAHSPHRASECLGGPWHRGRRERPVWRGCGNDRRDGRKPVRSRDRDKPNSILSRKTTTRILARFEYSDEQSF